MRNLSFFLNKYMPRRYLVVLILFLSLLTLQCYQVYRDVRTRYENCLQYRGKSLPFLSQCNLLMEDKLLIQHTLREFQFNPLYVVILLIMPLYDLLPLMARKWHIWHENRLLRRVERHDMITYPIQ